MKKTLEEIKEEAAKERGYSSMWWIQDKYSDDGMSMEEFMNDVAKRYAQSCCEDLRERIIKELDLASPETIRNIEIILP